MSASQLGAIQLGASQLGASQLGASQIGASQIGASQLGASQMEPLFNPIFKTSFLKHHPSVRMPHLNPSEKRNYESKRRHEAVANRIFCCPHCQHAFASQFCLKRHEQARSCLTLNITATSTSIAEIAPEATMIVSEPTTVQGAVSESFCCPDCGKEFQSRAGLELHGNACAIPILTVSPIPVAEVISGTVGIVSECTDVQDAVTESICHLDCGIEVQDRLGLELDRDACVIVPSTTPLTSMTVSARERRTASVETDAELIIEGTTKLTKCVDTEDLGMPTDAELDELVFHELPLPKKKPALVPPPSYKRPTSHAPLPPAKKYTTTLPGNVYRVYK